MPSPAINPGFKVYYDDQCEICQAGVTWLRALDRRRQVHCIALSGTTVPAGLTLEDCLRELHVVRPDGTIAVGWAAVTTLARLFSPTRVIGVLGSARPFRWLGDVLYRYVARNRFALSRCRGGACHSARPHDVRTRSTMAAFWSCRAAGLLLSLPVSAASWSARLCAQCNTYRRYSGKRIELLGGRLQICFLGGAACDIVPLLFGEQFLMIVYDGVAIDPGSPKMRASLERHLGRLGGPIDTVTTTHHHEEHVGNLEWLARRTGARLAMTPATLELVRQPAQLPPARRMIIGQPPPLTCPVDVIDAHLATRSGVLDVVPTPGHCDDHVSFYDRAHKLLLAGDAYMGAYFATPNPDVDSVRWIESLQRLLELDIEILVEGHGHIYTLRDDIPALPGLVVRQHPSEALRHKLHFFRWVARQIEQGRREDLPARAIEASCFPWGQRWSWENFLNDQLTRLLSMGHFSRSELIRSFRRERTPRQTLPDVFEVSIRR